MKPDRDYVVYVPSLWLIRYDVKAKSAKDAINKVQRGEVESSDVSEYERELGPKEWPWSVQYQKKQR
jgi:hypothetical protein